MKKSTTRYVVRSYEDGNIEYDIEVSEGQTPEDAALEFLGYGVYPVNDEDEDYPDEDNDV